jgi:putative MFS transporter
VTNSVNEDAKRLRRLLVYLSVATFFEGFDLIALVQVLPRIVTEMQLEPARTGLMVGVINVGAVLAFAIVRLADRFGRRAVLQLTIAGYTIASLLTGLSDSLTSFALTQLVARAFLLAEFGVSVVYIAEEYPESSRGRGIGALQIAATLGTIVCAGVAPKLMSTELGWRAVYFVGTLPLLLMLVARRSLSESRRFKQSPRREAGGLFESTLAIVRGPYKKRLLLLGSIWGLTYFCAQSVVTFWNLFAVQTRGFSLEDVSRMIMIAGLASAPMIFGVGRLIELGRRRAAAILYALMILGALGCYGFSDKSLVTLSLTLCFFSGTGIIPALSAFTAELFPTPMRAEAFALSNNLLGRLAYVLSPIVVGAAAAYVGYGPAVMASTIFPAFALALILIFLPETRGRSLEQTSDLVSSPTTGEVNTLAQY